ncbi:hypothetical protein J7I94_19940 [Streptomyces sp. ISL-12]|uniref:hypothetical protein n=1 Tax=Streptomyces sp. ISL-12 TaxID=2819177 RepID=UPI001BEC2C5F|nr:hypothetical protein [Streptomyces sp. ISL-12]MBT2412803.1 hypothetical protein [Streptomyces sp. ISL-12]
MNVKSRAFAGAVVGAAALSLTVMAPIASADPAPGDYRVLAGVGSDTTQDVLNGLGDSIDGGTLIASYDAITDPVDTDIKTRANGCALTRPNGSSAGIAALNQDIDSGAGCLDFARSSRSFQTAGDDLTWIPFASDKLKVAVRGDSALAGVNFSDTTLKAIYECTVTQVNGVSVTPLIPQSGSGTRSFFLSSIGNPTLGSCVQTMQEHDGRALDTAGDLAPYSVAKYASQTGGLIPDNHGATVLNTINGGEYSRDVYNVVETARLGDADIADTFVGPDSKVCQDTATITDYGFGTVTDCGSTEITGES